MRVLVGCDVGGTFTDAMALDPTEGAWATAKAPTTPEDRSLGTAAAIEQALQALGAQPGHVQRVLHGTTTATNALLEQDLARTALVTHKDMEDLLEIGRQDRPSLYDLSVTRPPALVSRQDRHGIQGRLDADGHEIEPLDEAELGRLARDLAEDPPEAVAVCMLHAYLATDHEATVADHLREALPSSVAVATSHEVSPEIREVERFTTTVLNAALVPRMEGYLSRLGAALAEIGIEAPIQVLDSAGAVLTSQEAARSPVRTLLSGPAGGAAGCLLSARELGRANVLGVDMGGTSTDVTLVQDGALTQAWQAKVAGYELQVPTADIHTVGAGGGSIAWLDEAQGLHVGPRSAGAQPGPACYGRGGDAPTVTDASLVLGRIPPEARLGGALALDAKAAHEAIATLADPLDLTVEAAARQVLEIASAHAVRGIRVLLARHAADPTELTMLGFGGAGPLFTAEWAAALGITQVAIPGQAGVHSAQGLLAAPPRVSRARSLVCELDEAGLALARDRLAALDEAALAALGHDPATTVHRVSCRYQGQSHELTLELPTGGPAAVRSTFAQAHEARFGYRLEAPVELVTVRSQATAEPAIHPDPTQAPPDRGPAEPASRTKAWFLGEQEGPLETQVHRATALEPGHLVPGPATVHGAHATTLIPPGWQATVLAGGRLSMEQEGQP